MTPLKSEASYHLHESRYCAQVRFKIGTMTNGTSHHSLWVLKWIHNYCRMSTMTALHISTELQRNLTTRRRAHVSDP